VGAAEKLLGEEVKLFELREEVGIEKQRGGGSFQGAAKMSGKWWDGNRDCQGNLIRQN
jgi:hypothetical protein